MPKELVKFDFTSDELKEIIPELVASEILKGVQTKRKVANLFKLDDYWVGTGMQEAYYPKIGTLSVSEMTSETGTVSAVDLSTNAVKVSRKMWGTGFKISDYILKNKQRNIVDIMMEQVEWAIAGKEEELAINALFGKATAEDTFSGDGSTTEFSLTHAPLYEVTSVTVDGSSVSNYTVDYYNGTITFGTAPGSGTDNIVVDYNYFGETYSLRDGSTSSRNYYIVNAGSSFGIDDIATAIAYVEGNGREPAFILGHPATVSKIFTLLNPLPIIGEPLLKGTKMQIFGLEVVSAPKMPRGTLAVVAKNPVALQVMFQEIYIKELEQALTPVKEFGVFFAENFILLDEHAVSFIVNI